MLSTLYIMRRRDGPGEFNVLMITGDTWRIRAYVPVSNCIMK